MNMGLIPWGSAIWVQLKNTGTGCRKISNKMIMTDVRSTLDRKDRDVARREQKEEVKTLEGPVLGARALTRAHRWMGKIQGH